MTTTLAGRLRGTGAASVLASVTAQFVPAGASLLLQLIAARELGAAGFAAFTLLVATLVVITTLHTAWVGDSLTVLDRHDPRVRAALLVSLLGTLTLGAGAGVGIALALGAARGADAALYGLLVLLWLAEDTGRRLQAARMEFHLVAQNAVADLAVTALTLGGLWLAAGRVTLTSLLTAMCAGCLAGVALALARLPRAELALPALPGAALREVAAFAGWRAAQAGLRPLTLLLTRTAIAMLVSGAALASVEGARLLLAPTLTLINGVGGFLLPRMVRLREAGAPLRPGLALTASLALSGAAACGGLAAVLLAAPLEPFLTGGNFPIDRLAVAGWAAYAVSIAATLPVALLATAYRRSRLVFTVRLAESLVGLAALLLLLLLRPDLVACAPFCIGTGGVVTSVILVLRLRAGRTPAGKG